MGSKAHALEGFIVGRNDPGLKAGPMKFQSVADAFVQPHHVSRIHAFTIGRVEHQHALVRARFEFEKIGLFDLNKGLHIGPLQTFHRLAHCAWMLVRRKNGRLNRGDGGHRFCTNRAPCVGFKIAPIHEGKVTPARLNWKSRRPKGCLGREGSRTAHGIVQGGAGPPATEGE